MGTLRTTAIAACILGWGVHAHAAEPTGIAVEFHNSFLDHYFVTADPAEAAAIESRTAGPAWTRTGGRFGVFRGATDAPGLSPVSRFFGPPGVVPNSHFYTSDPPELH